MKIMNRKIQWPARNSDESWAMLGREWIVTNGLGGYASGTVTGVLTRRYHGLLIAALPSPLGRTVMLTDLLEEVTLPDGRTVAFGGEEITGSNPLVHGAEYLSEFRLETGIPVWRFEVEGTVIEKRVLMPHLQNTVHVTYSMIEGKEPVRLCLRPALHFRPHEAPVNLPLEKPYSLTASENRYEISVGSVFPALRLKPTGRETAFTVEGRAIANVFYRTEAARGYESSGDLWTPGFFNSVLASDSDTTLFASTESWEVIDALDSVQAFEAEMERRRRLVAIAHPKARSEVPAELVVAADQFIIIPEGRVQDTARAHASGDEVRTVIAGYHWFTDWGRDTMISLEGLTLTTGRQTEAGWILRTFAHYIRDGLIPNMFPEGGREGLYHTADATLWFFHAIDRYLDYTDDRPTLRLLIPKLLDIVDHHVKGTRFGIGVDPRDGLLRQGAPGYQLTWMDAKVDDWVVTPRRGKAVEINALWYNALKLLEAWVAEEMGDQHARPLGELAEQARHSFNERFWYEEGGYLYDVVDGEQGDDTCCRPNQVMAISLPNPILDKDRWEPVMEKVRERLLTPVGLRSLSPGNRDYKPKYDGDLRSRDAAYHQGTVWAWLAGPYVDAWLKLHPGDRAGARQILEGFVPHLAEAGVGTISEIFDAEAPFTPRGCIAQAWSVAEVLRCWVKTAE